MALAPWLLATLVLLLAVACNGSAMGPARLPPRLDILTDGPEPLDPADAIPRTAVLGALPHSQRLSPFHPQFPYE